MSRIRTAIDGIKLFWSEVIAETQKCEWPPRQNLVETTFVIIVSLLLMASFIGASDRFLITVLKWIIQAK